jgi:hypothetical protein
MIHEATAADITISRSRSRGTAVFANAEGVRLASVVRAGRYCVRLYTGPDDFTYSEWATSAAAENVALQHTLRLA